MSSYKPLFGLNFFFFFSYNKQYEHSIYITEISINIIQKGSRRKSTDLFESVSLSGAQSLNIMPMSSQLP